MNPKIISFLIGRLLYALAIAMLIPFVLALHIHEPFWSFQVAAIITSIIAGMCLTFGEAPKTKITLREGIAITGLSWLIASFLSSIPFIICPDVSIIDCIFEGTSGITGTGGSVLKNIDSLPITINLWRSLLHWLGGLGIVVIFIALFCQSENSDMNMFFAEGAGPTNDKILPRIRSTAIVLLGIYASLTALLTLVLYLCDLEFFDALNNSMSAIATGGFSNRSDSIAYFDNVIAEIAISIAMLIGGGNFSLYILAYYQGLRVFNKNTEFNVYIMVYCFISACIAINLTLAMDTDFLQAIRYATFQTASIITTTGFSITNIDSWPSFSKLCLVLLMFTGGCAGSTAGGIKIARLTILFKMAYAYVLKKVYPHSIFNVRMDGKELSEDVIMRVARFFFIYIMLALLLGVIIALDGVPTMDAIALGISTMGNAGVAFGIAASTFDTLPNMSKVVCCFFMILGRLEIFTLLAMLRPDFWHRSNW